MRRHRCCLSRLFTIWCLSFNLDITTASEGRSEPLEPRNAFYDRNRDGSPFVWLLEDTYQGEDFLKNVNFFSGHHDPTSGWVRYVAREEAYQNRLAYVADNGNVILKADDTNQLPFGENRTSVRVNTVKDYSGGLFILDLDRAPWGCGIWPAWWSTAVGTGWPALGEIDIIEGVHDNQHNEMAWHTAEGCLLDTEEDFTGNVSIKHNGPATNCWAHLPGSNNVGCSITESSRSFFGPYFESQGGGVFAMKWDENGIAIWSFYRAAIPQDITNGTPNPSSWYKPSALLGPKKCDIEKYFRNHTIILNITFCGDWAGNTYEAAGCPGSCRERLMNPANFVNATWSIRSLKVYRKQLIHAEFVRNGGSSSSRGGPGLWTILALLPLLSIGLLG